MNLARIILNDRSVNLILVQSNYSKESKTFRLVISGRKQDSKQDGQTESRDFYVEDDLTNYSTVQTDNSPKSEQSLELLVSSKMVTSLNGQLLS